MLFLDFFEMVWILKYYGYKIILSTKQYKKIVYGISYRPRLRLNCIYNIVNYSNMMKKGDNKSKQEIIRDDVRKHAKI